MKHYLRFAAAAMLAAFIVPGVSLAQTSTSTSVLSSLVAEVQLLEAQIQSLESQIHMQEQAYGNASGTMPVPPNNSSTWVAATSSWCFNFSGNLSMGMSGQAVADLQDALNQDGESVPVNGTFDSKTAAAVDSFQQHYSSSILVPNGLSTPTGFVGISTRTKLNQLFGCRPPVGNPSSTPPVPPQSGSSTLPCPLLTPNATGANPSVAGGSTIIPCVHPCPMPVINTSGTMTPDYIIYCNPGGPIIPASGTRPCPPIPTPFNPALGTTTSQSIYCTPLAGYPTGTTWGTTSSVMVTTTATPPTPQ